MKKVFTVLAAGLLFALYPPGAVRAQDGNTEKGMDAVDVVTASATVTKIDLTHRKISLALESREKKTIKELRPNSAVKITIKFTGFMSTPSRYCMDTGAPAWLSRALRRFYLDFC
jgi:hypothetical protein